MIKGALLCLAIGAMIVNPGVAMADVADRLGYLVVEPPTGDLLTPMDIATSDVCTRGQMFVVKLDGPNLNGADRGNVIGATKIETIGPESYPGHYVVPLPTDLATYLASAAPGQRIRGEYTLTFACRNTLSPEDLQTFTATLAIDGKGRYEAQGESATPIGELIDGYVPGSIGVAAGDPAAPDIQDEADVSAAQVEVAPAASGQAPWRALLITLGALLLLGAAYAWWRGRDRTAPDRADSESPAEPPTRDDDSVGVGS